MTIQAYKENIRKYRGHLKSMDEQLQDIYLRGTPSFIQFSLVSKSIGVTKMAYIANNVPKEEQDKFVIWMGERTRCKNEVAVKLLSLI